jgi:hypothetical protein
MFWEIAYKEIKYLQGKLEVSKYISLLSVRTQHKWNIKGKKQ